MFIKFQVWCEIRLGNDASDAMKGKLAIQLTATSTTMKSIAISHSHKFRKFFTTDLKPIAHYRRFTKPVTT